MLRHVRSIYDGRTVYPVARSAAQIPAVEDTKAERESHQRGRAQDEQLAGSAPLASGSPELK